MVFFHNTARMGQKANELAAIVLPNGHDENFQITLI